MYDIFKAYLGKAGISEEEFVRIRSVCVIKKLRKRQYLLQEGDIWKQHAFIAKGCLRTYTIDEKGTEHILKFATENGWAGDRESLLSGTPSQFNIDAVEDTVVILFSNSNFELICTEIPALNNMVNTVLNRSFNASQSRIQAIISYTAEEKYRDFMSKYPDLIVRIPQSMIASYLGMTPETLSRVRKLSSGKQT